MSRIFIDGFESGQADIWDLTSSSVVSSAGLDMDGDYCANLNANYRYLQKNITVADDEMYFAFLYRPTSSGNAKDIFSLYYDATQLIHLKRSSTDFLLTAQVGVGAVETGTATLLVNTTYLVEVHIKLADAGGRFEVKVDGLQDIDFTGDTKPYTQTQFNRVRLGYADVYACYAYFDNFIMDDAAWIGNTNIQAVVPTGAGNTTGWAPSAGNNWECVDEKPFNDADYVSINSNDVVDTYAAGNLVGTIGSVKCVQVQSRALVDGSPIPTNLKLVVRSGGTDYLSGDNVVPIVAKSFSHLWENNPSDSAAWEEADVNAMEIGVKSAA